MTTPPNDTRKFEQPDGGQPEERLEFVLGPKENADGPPLDPDETRRRLAAQRELIERLAAECGIEVREVGQHPLTPQVPTVRANRIRQIAQPAMDQAAEDAKEQRNSLSVCKYMKHEGKDVRLTEFALLEFQSRERIGDIIRGLADFCKDPLPVGKMAVGLKVGLLRLVASIQHDGDAKASKHDDESVR